MRDPGQRLDPREQDGLAADDRGAGVEDHVDRFRPVGRRQDWISRMATEKLAAVRHAVARGRIEPRRRTRGSPAASSTSCARWKAKVDSAPSFSLTASSPSPSPQPPVAKS